MPAREYRTHRRYEPAPIRWTEAEHGAYLGALRERYGLGLADPNALYVDPRSGRVYAGSCYVCRVSLADPGNPDCAAEWAASVGAFDRIGGETVLSEYVAGEGRRA